MSFMKTNSVAISVDGFIYDSLTDFGLAIENTDYLGEPVQDTSNRIYVPGRSGYLDLTEPVFGQQWFTYRPIAIKFGGIRTTSEWDSVVSTFRNLFEGKICEITFANDPEWYWTGRVSIEAFQHKRQLGTFNFCINEADPFKYREHSYEFTSPDTIICLSNRKSVSPTITTDAAITVTYGTTTVTLDENTTTKVLDIVFEDGPNELTFTGAANVTVSWIEGSL